MAASIFAQFEVTASAGGGGDNVVDASAFGGVANAAAETLPSPPVASAAPRRGTLWRRLWQRARMPTPPDNGLPVLPEYADLVDARPSRDTSSSSRRMSGVAQRAATVSSFWSMDDADDDADDDAPTNVNDREARRRRAYDRLRAAVDALHTVTRHAPFNRIYPVNRAILRNMFVSLVPVFVGADLYTEFRAEIHAAWLGHAEVPSRFNAWTARQSGKSTALAVIMAVLMACGQCDAPNFISCYSASENQAKQLLMLMRNAYQRIPRRLRRGVEAAASGHVAVHYNRTGDGLDEHGQLRANPDCNVDLTVAAADLDDDDDAEEDDVGTLRCAVHSSSINTNRGDNALIWIIDEFCFNDERMFEQHYSVAMQFTGTRWVFCTTTPGDPRDTLTRTFQHWIDTDAETDDRLTLDLGLVCARHKELGTPLECRCRLHMVPPWVSVAAKFAEIRNAFGNRDKIMTELLGLPMSANEQVFTRAVLHEFAQMRIAVTRDTPIDNNIVYVAMDPSAASPQSELAIITFIVSRRVVVILGIESMNATACDVGDWCTVITEHVTSLLVTEAFIGRRATISVAPIFEMNNNSANTNSVFRWLKHYCERDIAVPIIDLFQMILPKTSHAQYALGAVHTGKDTKLAGVEHFKMLMSIGQIRFAEPLHTTGIESFSPDPEHGAMARRANRIEPRVRTDPAVPSLAESTVKAKFVDQLGRLAIDSNRGVCGKNGAEQDDLAITLLFALAYMTMADRYIQAARM